METRDSIADVWGPRTPHAGQWPNRVDERSIETPEQWVHRLTRGRWATMGREETSRMRLIKLEPLRDQGLIGRPA